MVKPFVVLMLTRKIVRPDVKPTNRIEVGEAKILDNEGFLPDPQSLVFDGAQLEEYNALGHYWM